MSAEVFGHAEAPLQMLDEGIEGWVAKLAWAAAATTADLAGVEEDEFFGAYRTRERADCIVDTSAFGENANP